MSAVYGVRRCSLAGLALAAAVVFASACGASQNGSSSGFASVFVDAAVDFVAELDGRPFPVLHHPAAGTLLRVPAGDHRLLLSADGYLPYQIDLSVEAGEVYDLHVEFWPVIPELDDSWID